jgi:multicomponent K+:H+ antiporter subunit D
MIAHLPILPIVLPLLTGTALLLAARWSPGARRAFGLASLLAQLAAALLLLRATSDGTVSVYALGDWAPPFGIVLVADRLAAAMLVLTALVALAGLAYAGARDPEASTPRFQALWQMQLFGVNGAFLTGDLFNLFVFFEVLLIASYALLLHGLGRERVTAAVHVVVLNLIGSALFLFAVGLIYAATGTLNLADLARVMPLLGPHDAPLAHAGALLLLVVFALKAALVPLGFWLPAAYGAATAAVAALFAVLTKVGAYSILRVYPLAFGPQAGELADVATPWVLPAGLATVVLGALGVLGAQALRQAAGWMVVYSVGTLLVGIGLFSGPGYAAAAFYAAHSTLAAAALFLTADLVAAHRGAAADRLDVAAPMPRGARLGVMFMLVAVALAGLPPLSGFAGKIMILDAAAETGRAALVWPLLLGSTLLVIVALARTGSRLFWNVLPPAADAGPGPDLPAAAWAAPAGLLACIVALVAWGGAAIRFSEDAGRQIATPAGYVEAVLGPAADRPETRRRLQ